MFGGKKIVNGTSLHNYAEMTQPPRGIPSCVPHSEVIRRLLCKSFSLQKSLGISDNCELVSLTLVECLTELRVKTKAVYGFLDLGYEGTSFYIPHVWVKINEKYVVDNVYHEEIPEAIQFATKPDRYKEEIPETERCHVSFDFHDKVATSYFLSNPAMFFALSRNQPEFNAYVVGMKAWIQEEMGQNEDSYLFPAERVEEKTCWHCKNQKENGAQHQMTKRCSACNQATYCGPKCQAADWVSVHKNICVSAI